MLKDKLKGIIKSYDENRSFGFIDEIGDKNRTYFFHTSSMRDNFKIEPLKTEVLFIPTENEKGLTAIEIEKITIKITGKFSCDALENKEVYLTNAERVRYLEKQRKDILNLLDGLQDYGIKTMSRYNWLELDTSIFLSQKEPKVDKRKRYYKHVPEGYCNTAKYLVANLESNIELFNRDYLLTTKGMEGEKEAVTALKSIMLEHAVRSNVRFEVKTEELTYSAEVDIIVITSNGIFAIEIKNIGGKNSTIYVSNDGVWTLSDGKTGKKRLLANPYKQSVDHKLAIQKLLRDNGIEAAKNIIPIIAIANNDVMLKVSSNPYPTVLRVDMLGTYISNYMDSNPVCFNEKEITDIQKILEQSCLEQNEYKVLDYYSKINDICSLIKELYVYWEGAEKENEKPKQVEKKKVKPKQSSKKIEKGKTLVVEKAISKDVSKKDKRKKEQDWYELDPMGRLIIRYLSTEIFIHLASENSVKLSWGSRIYEDNKVKKIKEKLNIPSSEPAFIIADATVFSTYAKGFAICRDAFYFIDDKKKSGRIEWRQFANLLIREKTFLEISDYSFNLGSKTKAAAAKTLLELQKQIRSIC